MDVIAFLRTPSRVRRMFLLDILCATDAPLLSPCVTPLTLLTQMTFRRVCVILLLVVRTSCRSMALILLFIHFVLASAAVLVTMNGIPTIPVSARVRHAPFMLAGFSSRTPDPDIRMLVSGLLSVRVV